MSLSHRKGFATVEDAMHSKVFLGTPGADLARDCPCGLVHVNKPAKRAATRRAPRDTGPSPVIRSTVWDRDNGWCIRCGLVLPEKLGGYSIHHRKLRSQGGENAPENLILLCGSGTTRCHGWVHANIDASRAMGWLLLESQEPGAVPVTVAVPGGWRRYWLTADGGRTTDRPEGVAA